jgi:hypothetical protein
MPIGEAGPWLHARTARETGPAHARAAAVVAREGRAARAGAYGSAAVVHAVAPVLAEVGRGHAHRESGRGPAAEVVHLAGALAAGPGSARARATECELVGLVHARPAALGQGPMRSVLLRSRGAVVGAGVVAVGVIHGGLAVGTGLRRGAADEDDQPQGGGERGQVLEHDGHTPRATA